MLANKFRTLCQKFSKDTARISLLGEEIRILHSQPIRYYHTLKHLEHIYKEFQSFKLTPLLEFGIFYHDIVYDVKRDDNEEQSALLAKKRLEELGVSSMLIEEVSQLIIETKTHKASSEVNAIFLDADLSILGSSQKRYKEYTQNVRKEYVFYDDTTYLFGRKKVLERFLDKERIYKSRYFYDKYERQARVNMLIEYNSLI